MAAIDRSLFLIDYKAEPCWWEAAKPDDSLSTDPPANTEFLIVGGGYEGLSAALDLTRAKRSVTVVGAGSLGAAASSRNGGCISAGINLGKSIAGGQGKNQTKLGEALLRESLAAYKYVINLIKREGIICNLEKRERFVGAYAPSHLPALANQAKNLNEFMALDAHLVSQSNQRNEIGSNFYHGGISIERAAKYHPALYHKALLKLCDAAGAIFSAQTRVTNINGSKENFVAETMKGNIKAEQVIICTNGYTGPLTPNLWKRIVPISSQIIVTEELSKNLAMEVIPKGRTISETPRVTCYYRLTPGDKRVMYGGRARFHNIHPDHNAILLHGMMIAQCILHSSQSDSAFFDLVFPHIPLPFYTGNPWFLPFIGNYFRLRDRLERG